MIWDDESFWHWGVWKVCAWITGILLVAAIIWGIWAYTMGYNFDELIPKIKVELSQ